MNPPDNIKVARAVDGIAATVTRGLSKYPLNPRFDLRNHSPTGFEVGYGGSGPAQLALAILAECIEPDEATRLYHDFKETKVASVQLKWGEDRIYTGKELGDWITATRIQHAVKT